MAAPTYDYEDLLARLRADIGRVGARELLREVLRKLPVQWDPRILEAARDLMKKFPPLADEFKVLESLAGVNVTSVVERALGREQEITAAIEAITERQAGEKLLRDLKAEKGRAKDERARLYAALGKKFLAIGDRKNGRIALRDAAQLAAQKDRAAIEAILDDLPGAKGREWRPADATVAVPGKPSDPAMLRVKGKDAPPKAMLEERFLAAPLLSKITAPSDALSIDVTLEHDAERIRSNSVRPKETATAPMVGMVARDAKGAVIGIVCGAFASPIERFPGVALAADTSHVSIRAGASFAETRLEPAGSPPNEGDGWLVLHDGRPFVRTRSGCWLRHPEKPVADAKTETRVRFRVTRQGLVWVALGVKPIIA